MRAFEYETDCRMSIARVGRCTCVATQVLYSSDATNKKSVTAMPGCMEMPVCPESCYALFCVTECYERAILIARTTIYINSSVYETVTDCDRANQHSQK